jgi:predicted ATPase/DNA-binding winged helix-turn-helix (wHTH) protein
MSGAAVHTQLRFGPFELSSGERILRRDGLVLPLGGRALDVLIYLAEHPGEVVTKSELIDYAWPDVVVEEGNLRVHIAAIRKALGDGKFGNRYIANIQGRGYSFVGSVAGLNGRETDGPSRQHEGILPARLRRMIGRDPVLGDVQESLRKERFVTLLGPGGIGKTTIAVAAGHALAEEFGGEVYFVDLGSFSDPDQVVRAIGTSLGLVLKSNDASVELVDLVRSRKLLVILDSCEHVIEAVAAVAERLYRAASQIYVLATSRELMRVEGEHCYHVLPLDFPPVDTEQTAETILRYTAVQLFVERVTARGASFFLSDREVPFIADMCRRLDGLPLAIELAAGPVAALGVKSAAARLVSRLPLLKLGHRTAVPRQQTLKATLDWSYDLLSDPERIVIRRIARFVDHFTLEGAKYVAGEKGANDGEIFDAIAGLVEKSLITTRLDQGEPQYRLLDTTRAYALGKLEEHGEVDLISARHSEYVVEELESKMTKISALPTAERWAIYSGQLSNIRAALEWSFGPHGDDGTATRLAAASMHVFLELSLFIECQAWAERAMARLGNTYQNSRCAMELAASLPLAMMHTEGNDQRIRTAFASALEAATDQGDLVYELKILSGLFMYSHWTMDIRGATDIAVRSKKLALKTGDPDDMVRAEVMLATSDHLLGNHVGVLTHCEAGLQYLRSGSRLHNEQYPFHYASFLIACMARSLLYRGLLDQSLDYAKRAREEGKKSGHPATLCRSMALVFPVFLAMADLRQLDEYVGELGSLAAAHSLAPFRAIAIGLKGQWLLLQNNRIDGVQWLKKSLRELHNQNHAMLKIDFTCDLAAALMDLGEHEQALPLIVNAIEQQQHAGKFLHMAALFRMKGLILASRSTEDHLEAERSLLSAIDWAKRQSATLFELKAATDLAELLLKQGRGPEAYEYLSAALDRMPAARIASPVHGRAQRILNRPRSGIKALG